ncbi:PAS domain S-box protein [Microcoleus sp. FACHB-672]|uniref:PAS domain S-box protein n=1 Tax=Microcoleus sp. FACHB-672 TaxID=2692825 RepID=UPI001684879D|nr:PAS domain S-box protein [Microcoleus sp. FACHB-672]MBD2043481.1 PAS domain S-box protein [Microcoleus sp. FACHB-672]
MNYPPSNNNLKSTSSPSLTDWNNSAPQLPKNWLNRLICRLEIRQKIGWGFALALGVAIVGVTTGFQIRNYYEQQAAELEKHTQEELNLLHRLQTAVLQSRGHQQQFAALIDNPDSLQEEYNHFLEHATEVNQVWSEFKSLAGSVSYANEMHTEEIPNLYQIYEGVPEAYFKQIEALLRQIKLPVLNTEESEAAQQQLLIFSKSPTALKFDGISDNLTELIQSSYEEQKQARAQLIAARRTGIEISAGSLMLSVVIAVALALYTSRLIAGPLEATTKVARRVTEEADFSLQAPVTTQDEVGKLTQSLNLLIQRVATYTQELQQAHAERDRFFNLSLEMFCITGFDGYFKQLNPAWEKTLGFTNEELLAKPLIELVHPEDQEATLAQTRKLTQGIDTISFVNRYLCKDGSYKWLEWASNPSAEENLIYTVARDITERKLSEAALHESEKRFRNLLSYSPVVVYSCKASGDFGATFMSENVKEHMGHEARDFLEDSSFWANRIHPEDAAKTLAGMSDLLVAGTQFLEYRFLYKDGLYHWIHDELKLVRDEAGNPLEIVGCWRDITERKQMESALKEANETLEIRVEERTAQLTETIEQREQEMAERRRAEEALYKEQEFLSALLNNLADGIVACDANGILTLFNRATQEFHGLPAQPIPAGEWAQHFDLYLPDGKTPMQREDIPLFRALQGEAVRDVEMVIVPKQGKTRILLANGQAIIDAAGKKLGAVVAMQDITDRKEAEAALSNSESRLNSILNSLKDVVWSTAFDTFELLYMNPAAETLYGRPQSEFYSKPSLWLEVAHPEDRDRVAKSASAWTEVNSQELEYRIIRADGDVRWIRSKSWLIYDEAGVVVRMDGLTSDITEYKEAQKAQARLTAILEATTDFVGVADANGRALYINKAGRQMLGFGEDEDVTSMFIPEFMAESVLDLILNEAWQTVVRDGVWSGESALRHRTGRDIPVSQVWMSHKSENGEVEFFSTVIRDISERKQAEEALQQREEQLRQIVQNMPVMMDTFDEQGNITVWNRECERVTGFSADEIIGNSKAIELMYPDPTYRASMMTLWATLGNDYRSWEWEITAKDGSVKTIAWSNISEEFPIPGWASWGIGVDVTERKQAEEALRHSEIQSRQLAQQAQEKAQQLEQTLHELKRTQAQLIQTEKMSSLGQMVAGVAHEINNPVNFIHGNLSHLNDYTTDLVDLIKLYSQCYPNPLPAVQDLLSQLDLEFVTEDLPKVLSSMKMGTERIRDIVLSLRNFSRLDEAEMKEVNIHEGLDNTLLILQNRLKAKSDQPEIQIIKEYGELPLVDCFAGQLNQVFMNLLANAIDALETVPLPRTITIRTYAVPSASGGGNRAVICIADNGSGMSKETQERLFDPFFTTKPIGKGTGLGLSISYQIVVEKHGGTLTCSSQPGKGTEFSIEIPIHQV